VLRAKPFLPRILLFAVASLAALSLMACGGKSKTSDGVQIEPANGGKPAEQQATVVPLPTLTPGQLTSDGTPAPNSGHWIDVDVTNYRVRLMDGTNSVRTFEPVGVGAQVDTGAYESTQTGTFRVYNKIAGLQYDPPYKTYISDWVGFDQNKANGFHSFLKDAKGNVVDPATGRISNGCIRTEESTAIFAYAEIGMPVYVHF
jgi:hypothetical protein